jgi:hypothetical protein
MKNYYRRNFVIVALLVNVVCFESCSITRIVAETDCDTFVNNPVNDKTTWSFFWGLVQPSDINPQCDTRFNHLNKVTVKTNLGYSIISVVTLGIVIPQHVQWCCAPYSPSTQDLGH